MDREPVKREDIDSVTGRVSPEKYNGRIAYHMNKLREQEKNENMTDDELYEMAKISMEKEFHNIGINPYIMQKINYSSGGKLKKSKSKSNSKSKRRLSNKKSKCKSKKSKTRGKSKKRH